MKSLFSKSLSLLTYPKTIAVPLKGWAQTKLKPSIFAEPNLVGREQELEKLDSSLRAAAQGKGTTVFVSGEAGSGKSKLSREFLDSAKNKGVIVLAGWCLGDAAVPYFPFIEAFNSYFEEAEKTKLAGASRNEVKIGFEKREIASWLSGTKILDKRVGVEPLSPQVWKDQAFDRVAKTLLTISFERPLVLFLEDVHWADSASLALLHYISRVVNNSEKILVLATFRSEEVTADAEGRPHPLKDEMRSMSREDLFSEIKLPNLSYADFSLIAKNMMGDRVQETLVEKISKESNGNALFLIESLRMLAERNGLVKKNNEWRLAVDDFGIPTKIKDIILRRLAVLNYSQRRVLDAAAVIGEKFNVDLLASVIKQDSLDVLDILNFVARSTALVSDEGVFYKFDHAKSREVLYEELTPSIKAGYHSRIAERLESGGKNGKLPFADLAYHYAKAGNEEKAVKYSLQAGLDALATFSNEEAIKNFQFVIEKVADQTSRFAERTAALEGLGDAFYASNNFRQARETFEQLAHLQKGAAKLRGLRKAIVATYYEINPAKLKELVLLAEEYSSSDRVEAARVLSHKARVNSVEFRYLECYPFLQEAINVYEEEYCLSDIAWDLFAMSNVCAWSGELEKGVACALRSLSIYDELGDIHSQLEAHLFAALCFSYCTLREEAVRLYRKLIELDSTFKVNDYVRLIPAHTGLGSNIAIVGEFKGAKILGLKALKYCNKSDELYRRNIGLVYSYLSWISFLEGDNEAGKEYYDKFMNLPQALRKTPQSIIYFNFMNAVYLASKNQFHEALASVKSLHDFYNRYMPCPGLEATVGTLRGWILEKEGLLEESRGILAQTQQIIDETEKIFAHFNIYAELITFTHPAVDQLFDLRFDVVNVSKLDGHIFKIENLLCQSLKVVNVSSNCVVKNQQVEFKDNKIGHFSVKTIKLTVMPTKPGRFILAPKVTYIDDLGQTKTSGTRTFQITVHPKIKEPGVAGKIATGFDELDKLLLGGIQETNSILLTAASSREEQYLVNTYVETGAQNSELTLYMTTHVKDSVCFIEKYPSSVYCIVCNPQVEAIVPNASNMIKLKGVENLTDIEIALTRTLRNAKVEIGPKRVCIDILSDILLQHHAVNTRKWLSGILTMLRSKGFTVLAIINPQMHPKEEVQAILSLFDGEIAISEKTMPDGRLGKTLRIGKLLNQKYDDREITLTIEK